MSEHNVGVSVSATDRLTAILERMGNGIVKMMRAWAIKEDATKTAEQIYCDCIYGYGENLE